MFCFCFFFFFQAEDGIRDRSPSRGLGDVYKRQVLISMGASFAFTKLPVVHTLSTGTRTILLTILIAGGAAILFPIDEEEDDTKSTESSVLNNNERQASHES